MSWLVIGGALVVMGALLGTAIAWLMLRSG